MFYTLQRIELYGWNSRWDVLGANLGVDYLVVILTIGIPVRTCILSVVHVISPFHTEFKDGYRYYGLFFPKRIESSLPSSLTSKPKIQVEEEGKTEENPKEQLPAEPASSVREFVLKAVLKDEMIGNFGGKSDFYGGERVTFESSDVLSALTEREKLFEIFLNESKKYEEIGEGRTDEVLSAYQDYMYLDEDFYRATVGETTWEFASVSNIGNESYKQAKRKFIPKAMLRKNRSATVGDVKTAEAFNEYIGEKEIYLSYANQFAEYYVYDEKSETYVRKKLGLIELARCLVIPYRQWLKIFPLAKAARFDSIFIIFFFLPLPRILIRNVRFKLGWMLFFTICYFVFFFVNPFMEKKNVLQGNKTPLTLIDELENILANQSWYKTAFGSTSYSPDLSEEEEESFKTGQKSNLGDRGFVRKDDSKNVEKEFELLLSKKYQKKYKYYQKILKTGRRISADDAFTKARKIAERRKKIRAETKSESLKDFFERYRKMLIEDEYQVAYDKIKEQHEKTSPKKKRSKMDLI